MPELAYLIESDSSTLPYLVIRFAQVDKRGQSPIPFSNPKALLPASLRQLITPQEKDLLNFLIQEECQFQKQQTGRIPLVESTSFPIIRISSIQAVKALEQFASTQKLYFKDKQLVIDLFGKVELYYALKSLDNHKVQVSGKLKWRDQEIDLQDCDWVGAGKPHHWFIRGISLKLISTDINWKDLQKLRQSHPWILEGAQKAGFLDSIDPEDPSSPKIIILDGSFHDIQQGIDPMPVLILKDRLGAGADLWMDYGSGQRIALHDPAKEIKTASGAIRRRLDVEKSWEKDLLETDFIRKSVGQSHYYCPVDKIAKSLSFLLEIGWHIQDWKGQTVKRQTATDVQIDSSFQHILIKGKVRYDNHETNLAQVMGAFNRRERFVELGSGTVGLLPDRWEMEGLQALAKEGEIVGDNIRVKRSQIGSIHSLFPQARVDQSLMHLQDKLQDFNKIQETTPGEAFIGQLRPYQQQGLNWLSFLVEYGFHGILADDMGLGKTVQVLALLSRLPTDRPHLIVLPTSLIFNWKKECERFVPSLPIYIHHGPSRLQSIDELQRYAIILTSYTTLRLDLSILEKVDYYSVILDEAQAIKNAHTQAAQAVCCLQAQFRLSITGTPIENHLGELWSHFHFLIPDLLGDESAFAAELQAAQSDSRYLQRIKKKIAPFILRRKKEQVAKDLPERIDQTMWIDMHDEQRKLYEQFLSSARQNLLQKVEVEGFQKHRLEVFETILRLRQICCHPELVSILYEEQTFLKSSKLEALEEDLETIVDEGRKVLIYSQFTSMLKLMAKRAKEKGWSYTYLDGQTVNREKVVQQFQEDASTHLFFISLKAGGVGLNLTAADYVFLYDPWWNEAVEEQAINRAHRIGRHETVIAKRLVMRESIEEKMMRLKESKRLMIQDIYEDQNIPLNLTSEDLRYLLS